MGETDADVPIRVSVDPDRFDVASRALSEAGVNVEDELRAIDTITGTVQLGKLTSLDLLEGVLVVELQGPPFQLAPPDADVQLAPGPE